MQAIHHSLSRAGAFWSRALIHAAVLGGAAAVLCGCGGNQRQPISGSVSYDGAPLASGVVTITPEQGTPGPSAGAVIENGRFAIAAAEGVFAGKFRVAITAERPSTTNKVFDYETRKMVVVPEQFLPAQYNDASDLVIDVTADGDNQFAFDLKPQ